MNGRNQKEQVGGYYGAIAQSECTIQIETMGDKQRSGKELWEELQNHIVEQKSFQLQDLRDLDQMESGHSGSRKREKNPKGIQAKHIDELDLPFDFTMTDCALAFFCYLLVSVLAFSFIFEKWPMVDSLYFAVVTFTTIGYGDLYPHSAAGKIFCVVFAFCGVASLSIGLGVVGATVVEAELKAATRVEKEFSKEFLKLFRRSADKAVIPPSSSFTSFASSNDTSSRAAAICSRRLHEEEKEISGYTFWKESSILLCRMLFRYTPAMMPLLLGAGLMAHYEGWQWYDTLYYCVITTTTIGYGDRTPSHELLRLFAVFFIPLAVGAMGHMMGAVANFIMDRRRLVYQRRLLNHDLTMHDLETMDEDHDGVVTELEFLVFMLTTLKKVDKETVEMIREQFRRLDLTESGTLVRKDLELMAQKNLKRVRNKLQLSAYKRRLTAQGSRSNGVS